MASNGGGGRGHVSVVLLWTFGALWLCNYLQNLRRLAVTLLNASCFSIGLNKDLAETTSAAVSPHASENICFKADNQLL